MIYEFCFLSLSGIFQQQAFHLCTQVSNQGRSLFHFCVTFHKYNHIFPISFWQSIKIYARFLASISNVGIRMGLACSYKTSEVSLSGSPFLMSRFFETPKNHV